MRAHMYLCLYVSLCVFEYVFASLLRKPPESEVAEVIRLLSLSHIFDCEEDCRTEFKESMDCERREIINVQ